jgi:TolB-like protein/outer membrane protein assembly factor BamB
LRNPEVVSDTPNTRGHRPRLQKTGKAEIHNLAVVDFENLTGEKTLDPYTVGISETLSAELAHVRGLTIVERNRVNEAQPGGNARDTARSIGADAVVTGSFQKLGTQVRLTARVFDAENGMVVAAPPPVDGSFKDLFKLQADLAKQVATAINGSLTPAKTETSHSLETFQAFSSGLYYLKQDLAADALAKFDETLRIDPAYPGANHNRGLALAKLHRLDEAIEAFKRALPQSNPERLISWSWDAPVSAPQRGLLRALDSSQIHLQRDVFENRRLSLLQKRFIYTERTGKTTALHFLDPAAHSERRREIPDENIVLDGAAYGNDTFTIIATAGRKRLYAFSADSALLWDKDLVDYGNDPPRFALLGDALYIYAPGLMRLDLFDIRTGNLLWRREGLAIDGAEPPIVRRTKASGEIFIVKSGDRYRAIRKSDGKDAWAVPVESAKVSELAGDRTLVVFEPERRVFTVDLETGRTTGELSIEQVVDALPTGVGPKWLVAAVLDGSRLYVLSKDLEFVAIDLRKPRIVWRTPLQKKIQPMRVHGNRVYLGSETGEVIVLDTVSGAVTATTKLTDKPVVIDYAGDDGEVARSNGTVFGLGTTGVKSWEYPLSVAVDEAMYFNHAIVEATSPTQLTTLDVRTGKMLWQYAAARPPFVFTTAGRLFLLDDKGAKEYAVDQPADAVSDKQTLTELARVYLEKRDLKQAELFAGKAGEIDASYPPLVLVRARMLKVQGNAVRAGKELAQYASLVGIGSKEGRRAIAELKQDHGLAWETEVGEAIAGEPVAVEDRVVSVGRAVERDLGIVALNAQSGAVAWSFGAERFAASVMDGRSLWYVSGRQSDGTSADLFRIDIRTGEGKLVASWRAREHVEPAWITTANGRVFVATASSDLEKGTLAVASECFDAKSGARVSEKSYSVKASAVELAHLDLIFNGAQQEWKVGRKNDPASPPERILWPPSSFRVQAGRFYAFTSDGLAYSMQ